MHFRVPKPLHGWRAFTGEVGIIVVGVLIALAAEQAVQAVQWHYEVQATQSAIDAELGDDLRWALQLKQFEPCSTEFLDKLQTAVIAHDTAQVRKLVAIRQVDDPFPPAPWSYGTYSATLGNEVAEHLPDGRMAAYFREFTWVPLQMQFQVKLYDELATAMTASLGVPSTPATLDQELAAILRLRSDQNGRLDIAGAMIEYGHDNLSVSPSRRAYIAENGVNAKRCEARLRAV